MVKLSIVIPYYETYELTDKLLTELCRQKTDEVEILLIDNGCNETRLDKHKQVDVIHRDKNYGVSSSRNLGIKKATGKYIAFIDSDDMVTEDYIESLINLIDTRDDDIFYFNWQNTYTKKIVRRPSNPAVWKAIYRKEIVPMFNEELYCNEDLPFHEEIKNNNCKKYYLDKLLYLYNANRVGSLTWNKLHKMEVNMKYIIMCGGKYEMWETPRHLSKICGEELVERTIRLLRENGVEDISISSDNPMFEKFGLPVLKHDNSYVAHNFADIQGDWFDAFYPTDEPTCYIFGDVLFSPEAIKTIVETETDDIEFFGSMPPFADNYIKDHEEPFALKVVNTKHLKEAIQKTKELDKQGKFWRKPLMWELWTVIKDAPLQTVPGEYTTDYVVINDYTVDVDRKSDVPELQELLEKINK